MNQKGFAPVILIVLISLILVGVLAYNLGKQSNKPVPVQTQQSATNQVISTIQTPQDSTNWVQYSIKTLEMRFKLPPDLAKKYGKLVAKEVKGERGSELEISFENDPTNLIITAQSPEYIEIIPTLSPNKIEERVVGDIGIRTLSVFQGFKYENGAYSGLLPLGRQQDLPTSSVTQYRVNGKNILKAKAFYIQPGMVNQIVFSGNPAILWGIINGTGNSIYPGLTVQGTIDKELTESTFEQILSTFSNW